MKLETIEALLAKAESTTHEAEAEAFMAKAEALMVKYGIDDAMLAASKPTVEEIITHRLEFAGTYQKPLLLGAHLVARGLSDAIHTHQIGGDSARWLVLVGYEGDIARAAQLIASLQLQALNAMQEWWQREGRAGARAAHATNRQQLLHRRGFLVGYLRAAADRLTQLRINQTKEATNTTPGTEVALFNRAHAVDAWVNREYGSMRSARSWSTDASGQRAGRVAGASADIGQGRMGGNSRQIGA